MQTFLIVFVLALLFVIGSASAMRYFGNPRLPTKEPEEKNPRNETDRD